MNGHPEEEKLGKVYDRRLVRQLLRYLRPYLGLVVCAVALLIVASSFRLVGPILTEIASVAPIYSGLNWDVVSKSQGIRWSALPENVAEGGSPFLSLEVIQQGLPSVQEVAETTAAGD